MMSLIQRQMLRELKSLHSRERGRLLVLTGARQTGKSTLAGMAFPEYPVVNLDSPVERTVYEQMVCQPGETARPTTQAAFP